MQKDMEALKIPVGEWTPPDAGDAPGEIKTILRTVYSDCRDKNPAETPEAKAKCASISWGAVRNAGWKKDSDGKWVKETKNLEDLATEPGEISSFHNVTLQRLDVYQTNNGSKVLYPEKHFSNVKDWQGVPVIYQRTQGGKIGAHPEFNNVDNDTLDPDRYVKVGHIEIADLTNEGEPALVAEVAFTNPNCTLAAQGRELSLSTGFSAPITNLDDGKRSIAGRVIPNHVLIFRRGSCPNCYANDNGAQFHNMIGSEIAGDDEMDDESKGYLKTIAEGIKNMIPMGPATPASVTEENKMADIKNEDGMDYKAMYEELKAKYDALMAKMSETENMTNLVEKYKAANEEAKVAFENIVKENADLKWAMVRNILPAGWVDTPEKEAVTRAEYTDKPHDFAQKLAKHVNQIPADKPAEGETVVNIGAEDNKEWGAIGVPSKK